MTIRFYKMLVMITAMECHRGCHAVTRYVITKKDSCGMGRRHKGLYASRFAGHVHFVVSDIDGGSTPLSFLINDNGSAFLSLGFIGFVNIAIKKCFQYKLVLG